MFLMIVLVNLLLSTDETCESFTWGSSEEWNEVLAWYALWLSWYSTNHGRI